MFAWLSVVYLLTAGWWYVQAPVATLREAATVDSPVASEAYFAEPVTLLDPGAVWSQIQTSDTYTGWVLSSTLTCRPEPYHFHVTTNRLKAHLYSIKDTIYGPIISLPYGSPLYVTDASDARWLAVLLPNGTACYIQKGDVAMETFSPYKEGEGQIFDPMGDATHHLSRTSSLSKAELPRFSQLFLGLPYTWGGRSSFGFDCSGFVQSLYRAIGVDLPRDSKQQAIDPRFQTIAPEALEPGDLLFFGRSKQQISHVGMYLGDGYFIHATVSENQPWIRISALSDTLWSGQPESPLPYRVARQLLTQANDVL